MKLISTFVLVLSLSAVAYGKEIDTITCSLKDASNSTNAISITADLNNLQDDGLYSSDGIDIGDDNYSFDLSITKELNGSVVVDAIFYENKHVQDEVASYGWELLQKGMGVIQEPLTDDDKTVMNFVCDYK
jgi:hypothetical protein